MKIVGILAIITAILISYLGFVLGDISAPPKDDTLSVQSQQYLKDIYENSKDSVNFSSQVQGDIIYSDGTSWARLGTGTSGQVLITNGSGANPSWSGMTTQGDIEYHNGTTRTRLAAGTSGYYLKTQGAGANPAWAEVSTVNTSNVIYCWLGSDNAATNTFGLKGGTSLVPAMSTYTVDYQFFGVYADTERTILTGRFVKIAGISTITIHARLWSINTGDTFEAILKADIGGQNNTVKSVTSITPTWVATSNIDVSGLTNGTTYDITINLYNENSAMSSYCSGVILTAS